MRRSKKLNKIPIIIGSVVIIILITASIAACSNSFSIKQIQSLGPNSAFSTSVSPSASPESSISSMPSTSSAGNEDTQNSEKVESNKTEFDRTESSASESHAASKSPSASTATAKPTSTPKPSSGSTATANNPTAIPKPAAMTTPKPAATATPKPSATVTPKPTAKPTATPEPKKVWVVDVSAQEEQGHWEEEYYVTSDWVYQCNGCGTQFATTDAVNDHISNNWDNESLHSYTMVSGPTYEVYTGNKYWIVDVPTQEEQGHWEYVN